ncbi:hypothetical protein FRC10_009050 [Ceratobasidium sp. 414]|nr:hypothetical protein FRC10_009050 [Ceratobasidium sp. 414]
MSGGMSGIGGTSGMRGMDSMGGLGSPGKRGEKRHASGPVPPSLDRGQKGGPRYSPNRPRISFDWFRSTSKGSGGRANDDGSGLVNDDPDRPERWGQPQDESEEASYVSPETTFLRPTGGDPSASLFLPASLNLGRIRGVIPTLQFVAYGCEDITDKLDLASSSDFPVSTGGFGDVYEVRLWNGTQVTVKTRGVRVGFTDEGAKYIKAWAKCDHPNVLRLLGLAEFRGQIGTVSPWMKHDSLPGYLFREPTADRCQISTQICEGLAYLHQSDMVHGDLKGLNVLVSDDGTPVLTDFGNAILRGDTPSFTAIGMTLGFSRWVAPELLEGLNSYSMEADVYALGMEAITGNVPHFKQRHYTAVHALLPARPEATIPSDSKHGDELWALLVSCWLPQPKERPSAGKVAGIMKTIQRHGLLRDQPHNRGSGSMSK